MGKMRTLNTSRSAVFEQGRVFGFAHDVLVDFSRFVGGTNTRLPPVAADVHGELVQLRALGDGKQIRAFELRGFGL